MKLSTVIIGLVLAFLLFTPQGQGIGSVVAELAFDAATKAAPAKVAAPNACLEAWDAARRADIQKAKDPLLPHSLQLFREQGVGGSSPA